MPAVIAWLVAAGLKKLAGWAAVAAGVGTAFYYYSFEICLMGAMVSLFFSMFGFSLARKGVLFSLALYVVTQVLGASLK